MQPLDHDAPRPLSGSPGGAAFLEILVDLPLLPLLRFSENAHVVIRGHARGRA